ncbi:MAG: mechanosensitive ion channel family protein [Firmicutes bacterium]|nr:mechanosensitive ion channel family protein [Bacillota bacterium]
MSVRHCHLYLLIVFLLLSGMPPSLTQESSSPPVPVRIGNKEVFVLRHALGGMSVQQRVALVNYRLEKLVQDRLADPADFVVGIDRVTGLPYIQHKRYKGILLVIGEQDAGERSPLSVATEYAERLEFALREIRLQQQKKEEQRRLRELRREYTRATMLAIMYSVLLPLVWHFVRRLTSFIDQRLQRSSICSNGVCWRQATLISPQKVTILMARIISIEHFVAYTVILLVYIQLLLATFPATRPHSDLLQRAALQTLSRMGSAIVDSIPGIVNIFIIVIVARLVLRGFEMVMTYAESGAVSLEPYVPHEFVRPTRSLGKFVIVLVALFFIAPNIPGAGTDFAKVVTVFMGVIVSFSSSTTVGNFIAGIVIAYMRPFRRGDRVKIGDYVGDIVDSTFMYTRLRTLKNEDVLIPSLQILSASVVNYSSAPNGIILHTTVSIGYDVPRQQVEALLIEAALRTEDCEKNPAPFVLITSLDDSYVTYELNVYTSCPNRLQVIYSRLHQNIKDVFDAAEIEIMSPTYLAIRDGNRITIPDRNTQSQ